MCPIPEFPFSNRENPRYYLNTILGIACSVVFLYVSCGLAFILDEHLWFLSEFFTF